VRALLLRLLLNKAPSFIKVSPHVGLIDVGILELSTPVD
jgi:hypothetical protein